jgi:hypothetical protein
MDAHARRIGHQSHVFRGSAGTVCTTHVFLSLLNIDDDALCLMVMRKSTGGSSDGHVPKTSREVWPLFKTICQNRARLQSIKTSLDDLFPLVDEKKPQLLQELEAVNEALCSINRRLLEGEDSESGRHLAVEVMNCSLDYWTQCIGLSKVELARQSKLRKTSANRDGWERTRRWTVT